MEDNWLYAMFVLPVLIYLVRTQIELTWMSLVMVLGREYEVGDYIEIYGPEGKWAPAIILDYFVRFPFKRKKGVWIAQRVCGTYYVRRIGYAEWKTIATRKPMTYNEQAEYEQKLALLDS